MRKTSITNRIIWIILAFGLWYILIGETACVGFGNLVIWLVKNPSDELLFVLNLYMPLFASCVVFLIMCRIIKKDRPMLEVVRPTKAKRSMHWLAVGLLLGFLTNFFCILCAIIHGDIKFEWDFRAAQIPLMLIALLAVFFQSTSEELWCRVMMYERISVHYPLWVAIVVNGVVFGLLHSFNDGITALAMADLIMCGLAYSLLRWYTKSPWACFGIHTMWNFTQNFIFGLPNSGLVSGASMFRVDALNAVSNLIYDYDFGVEGALPAVFIDLLLGGVCLYLGAKQGRLGELLVSKEQTGEASAYMSRREEAKLRESEALQASEPLETIKTPDPEDQAQN